MLIHDVALIFEGGAMRNAYTAPVVDALLRNDLIFTHAYGIERGREQCERELPAWRKWLLG